MNVLARSLAITAGCVWALGMACGCGSGGSDGGSTSPPPGGPGFSFQLANSSATAFPQEGAVAETAASVGITVTRTSSTAAITASVSNMPAGAKATVTSPGSGNAGTLGLSAGTAAPGTYSLTVSLTDGTSNVTQPLSLTIGATTVVGNAAAGTLDEAMSTSFQIAEWTSNFFQQYAGSGTTPGAATLLGNLEPQHVRMQILSQAIPETAAGAWDFTMADASVQPILGVGDHSPEFQIATGPAFLYTSGTPSQGDFTDATYQQFADYTANLVRYYNTGGFTVGGRLYKSASVNPITWWGIYNEPNYNGVTPDEYVTLYDAVVPAMQAVDPSLKFVALELGDAQGVDQTYLPTFVQGVTAQVDALGTHFYSTCNQQATDATVMATIPTFASWVRYEYSELSTNPALADVPVWVLESNVNADYASSNGMSMCNPGQKFVADTRGSDAFFAAWRTYEFSVLGKAGVRALYHWSFDGDTQFGEFNSATGNLQLSYWVDYWLSRMFPSAQGAAIYSVTGTDESDVEVLAVQESSGQTVVMVSDHGVANANDDNGSGVPRTVLLDVSALGSFTTAQEVVIDKTTSAATGPTEQTVAVAPQMQVTLGGYGVAFLVLQ